MDSDRKALMADNLTFMMGEFAAEFPVDRMYADNHMWAHPVNPAAVPSEPSTYRFGFTAYAVRLLQDVYFLDWLVEAPGDLTLRQEIGSIESKKAESALYAPIAGQLTIFNDELLSDPSAINVDKYGRGWLFELAGEKGNLLNAAQYVELLESVWEKTQRTIKGQLNE